LSWLV